MIKFPLEYEVFMEADSLLNTCAEGQINAQSPIPCAIPVEFGGPGSGYTAEDLFSMAVLNCIISTFKWLCHKEGLAFKKIKGKSILKMTVDADKRLFFPDIDITLEVEGASNLEKIKKSVEDAVNNCPVSNSIKIPKTLHIIVK